MQAAAARTKHLLVTMPEPEYRRLELLAEAEDRGVERQASHMLKRLLKELTSQIEAPQEGAQNESRQRLSHAAGHSGEGAWQ